MGTPTGLRRADRVDLVELDVVLGPPDGVANTIERGVDLHHPLRGGLARDVRVVPARQPAIGSLDRRRHRPRSVRPRARSMRRWLWLTPRILPRRLGRCDYWAAHPPPELTVANARSHSVRGHTVDSRTVVTIRIVDVADEAGFGRTAVRGPRLRPSDVRLLGRRCARFEGVATGLLLNDPHRPRTAPRGRFRTTRSSRTSRRRRSRTRSPWIAQFTTRSLDARRGPGGPEPVRADDRARPDRRDPTPRASCNCSPAVSAWPAPMRRSSNATMSRWRTASSVR